MQYVAHRALLDARHEEPGKPPSEWRTVRAHYQMLAPFSAPARAALVPPDYPEWMGYVLAWSDALTGRSGSANGELTWPAVVAWRDLSGEAPLPHEVDALLSLDYARTYPDKIDMPVVEAAAPRAKGTAWAAWEARVRGTTTEVR